MRCPFCLDIDTRVVDSRLASDDNQIRRRRECNKCLERFTTYESVELNLPKILKSDGRREPFDEAKLRASISRAIEKQPVAVDKIETAITKIQYKLKAAGEREVESKKLGGWVMEQLRQLDQVAYIRFASVYRNFQELREFLQEIELLKNDLPPEIRANQLALLDNDGKES